MVQHDSVLANALTNAELTAGSLCMLVAAGQLCTVTVVDIETVGEGDGAGCPAVVTPADGLAVAIVTPAGVDVFFVVLTAPWKHSSGCWRARRKLAKFMRRKVSTKSPCTV